MTVEHVYGDVDRQYREGAHVSPEHMTELATRFSGIDVDLPYLVDSLETLTNNSVSRRLEFETRNVGRLDLSAADRNEYLRLLGRRQHMGEFIHWLGVHATQVLTRPECEGNKITLELGGNLQFGDWDSTREIDKIPNDIAEQLRAHDPAIKYELLARDPSRYRYLFYPYFRDIAGRDFSFDHGTIIRTRPAADLEIPRLVHMEVHKQSYGMLLMNLTDEETRDKLRHLSSQGEEHEGNKKNSPASLAAGAAFERAAHEAEGSTLDVIPIGAHYFVTAWNLSAEF